MTYEDCCDYFKKKCLEWDSISPDHDMKKYIEKKGKNGLATEFKADSIFQNIVCPFLKEYAQGKEKDITSSIINDALDLVQGNLLPTQLNILIAAILEACGYSDLASKMLKAAVVAIVLAAVGSMIGSLLKK